MADLKNPTLIYLKGWMFLFILLTAGYLILVEAPSWKVAGLLWLVIWSSARFYYFMFYVIEKYLDTNYRFSGIGSFVMYLLNRKSDKF